jgi:hypothetical protein
MKEAIGRRFCSCIKKVRRTVKARINSGNINKNREKAAIAICVKSVLHSKGKTIKRFTCRSPKGPKVEIQKKRST